MFVKNQDRILVTGGQGMIGCALREFIPKAHFLPRKHDLRDADTVKRIFKSKWHQVIHLAAKVGGVHANMSQMADFYTDNILINTNVLRYAAECHSVEKVVSVLSTCIYPDQVNYPLTEDQIHNGPPHSSNFAYAYAKRMLDVHSRALREQFGKDFITVVANNLFGENDSFHLENGHVLPAMIRKIHEAKIFNRKVVLWGDGSPEREFTYSNDFAYAVLFAMEHYRGAEPINIGNTKQITIREAAETICRVSDYEFNAIEWDTSRPMGQPKKPSSNQRFLDLGWKDGFYTDFEEAMRKTIKWFVDRYPNVRGIG
jgi:GDP-L-fucose synthase